MRILTLTAAFIAGVVTVALLLLNYRDDVLRRQQARQLLFAELQPIALENCELERIGEPNDGGYLMCANLLSTVTGGYSYGIAGYDGWGCDISRRLSVRVHQYDCFDTRRTTCRGGDLLFHEECVAGTHRNDNGRAFSPLPDQIIRDGNERKRLVLKMDIEGAEWETLESAPADVLDAIDQLAIELHGTDEERFLRVVRKLKQTFYVVHLHFNNHSCRDDQAPFPSSAYEVLFVNKRLGKPELSRRPELPHRLDARNNPAAADCQANAGVRP